MLKYFVVSRGDDVSNQTMDKFHQLAAQYQMILDTEQPDIVLSIGGDGTMLHAFHMYVHRLEQTSFVGIHTGRLGFFADWQPEEIEHLAQLIATTSRDHLKIVHYPLVQIEITTAHTKEVYLALNEFTLKTVESTLVAQLDINDQRFEMFRGDGICISTPIGSTAYNKSLGGALLHPSLHTMQIAEIASINNRVYRTIGSSLVIPQHHHCDILPKPGQKLLLSLDHLSEQRNDVISIRCMVADKQVNFARYRPFPFWSRVREAFIEYDDEN